MKILLIDFVLLIFLVIIILNSKKRNKSFVYIDGKNINKNNVPIFRDIPCNKDIYYANALIYFNDFEYKRSNILGAIILKWVKENKILFKNEKEGLFNKETSIIDLSLNPIFDYDMEAKLFNVMYETSNDGILFVKDFEKICRGNSSRVSNILDTIMVDQVISIKNSGDISYGDSSIISSHKNVMSDRIYKDSVQLYGLKKYLEEFSMVDIKEIKEVKLWDEYLMFAYLFGIADKISNQLKGMDLEFDLMVLLDNLEFINNVVMFVEDTVSAISTLTKLGC